MGWEDREAIGGDSILLQPCPLRLSNCRASPGKVILSPLQAELLICLAVSKGVEMGSASE